MRRIEGKLRQDFIQFMHQRMAFPEPKNFEKSVRETGNADGIRNGVYAEMIEGRVVDRKHIVALVHHLRSAAQSPAERHCTIAFSEYHSSVNSNDTDNRSDAEIASDLIDMEIDYVGLGNEGFFKAFTAKRLVERSVADFPDDAKVRQAIHWMYADVCREVAPQVSDLSSKAAIQAAEAHIGIPLTDYQERAIRWREFDHWTVLQGLGKRKPTAITIVLPLRDEAYDAVRSGQIATYDVKPSDLERPSRSLLIESCSERIPALGGELGNTTRYSAKALVIQVGILSRCHGKAAKQPLRVLTFAGTPNARTRVKNHGYKPTGFKMPRSGVDIYERVFKWPPKSTEDLMFLGLLGLLGDLGDDMLRPPKEDPTTEQ